MRAKPAKTITTAKRQMRAQAQEAKELCLDFSKQPCMAAAIESVIEAYGLVPDEEGRILLEEMIVGARGDGKTVGAFTAMLGHAKRHEEAGYPLPVKWMGVMDTFRSHELKTHETLQEALWRGTWTLSGDKKVARGWSDGRKKLLVEVDLFGVEDHGAMDKMRMAAHCLWIDEAAPTAVLVQSSGLSETAYLTGLTSLRLPSHVNVALLTENYPDEDHWTWLRWAELARNRRLYRIPPGERASASQRAAWAKALANRPDLLKRLLEGQPGGVMLGPQVADGFNQDVHVAKKRLRLHRGEPVLFAQDFGHTPATLIGQPWQGRINIVAALACERGGIKQLYESVVIPWLRMHAPWVLEDANLVVGIYDPAGATADETDIEQNPLDLLEKLLPGRWSPGPVAWESRKNAMLALLNRPFTPGTTALQIDPVDGRPLIQALNGRWHYPQSHTGAITRDLPKKPNHPWEDHGDNFCYFASGLNAVAHVWEPPKVETETTLALGAGAR